MLEKNHRNGMEEILNNMDTMQKLMSSIAVTYDTSDESPESQWSKLYFEGDYAADVYSGGCRAD